MNVLLVSEPGENGVFRYVEALAHYLISQGVRVHLAYSDRRCCSQLAAFVALVEKRGGATLNLAVDNRPGPADIRALLALHRLVRRVRPDIIHSHSSKAGALARLLRFLGVGVRQVYHPHAYVGMRPQSPWSRLFFNTVESILGRCGTTIAVSPDEQGYACGPLGLPPGRVVCVPNGVDTDLFRPPTREEKRALRSALGLPVDAVILGSLGRASVQKDPLTLYRAFVRALGADPSLVLFHLGSGELEAELDKFIGKHGLADRIIRRPYLATPADFYRSLDAFVLTSVYEGLSIAVLEALSCGLPLILSNGPGNRTFLRLPLSHFWSAPVGDAAAFAAAIAHCVAGVRSGETAWYSNHRQVAIRRFDAPNNFYSVLEIYRELLANGRLVTARVGLGELVAEAGQR